MFGNNLVLELKFTNRDPDWFRELVRIFGLAQCGAAKYVDGVTLIGESKVRMSLDANGHPLVTNLEEIKNESNGSLVFTGRLYPYTN